MSNDSKQQAASAIRKVAQMKAEKLFTPIAQSKANMTMKDLGLNPDNVGITLGLLKGALDLNQGQLEVPVSKELDLGITNKEDDKGIRIKFNKKFD